MVEKNLKKLIAKKSRAFFEGNLGTVTFKTVKYPDRNTRKIMDKKEFKLWV